MKKLVNIITRNAIGFIVGALVFGGVLGAVAAVSISVNDIAFTTSKNTNVATVKDEVDDLYLKAGKYEKLLDYSKVTGSGITYKYSKDSDIIAYNVEPDENVSTTNSSYSNEEIYLRTTYINRTATDHSACYKYNDKEFCIEPNYWVCPLYTQTNECGLKTKAKLQAAMGAALGTSADRCDSNSDIASCHHFGSACCFANFVGNVYCEDDSGRAGVVSGGSAFFGY